MQYDGVFLSVNFRKHACDNVCAFHDTVRGTVSDMGDLGVCTVSDIGDLCL